MVSLIPLTFFLCIDWMSDHKSWVNSLSISDGAKKILSDVDGDELSLVMSYESLDARRSALIAYGIEERYIAHILSKWLKKGIVQACWLTCLSFGVCSVCSSTLLIGLVLVCICYILSVLVLLAQVSDSRLETSHSCSLTC